MLRILINKVQESTYYFQDKETKMTSALDTTGSRKSKYQLRLTSRHQFNTNAMQIHIQVHLNVARYVHVLLKYVL